MCEIIWQLHILGIGYGTFQEDDILKTDNTNTASHISIELVYYNLDTLRLAINILIIKMSWFSSSFLKYTILDHNLLYISV